MKKSKFTESQILNILKEKEQGFSVAELCRKHGISEPTYYSWKSKYSGMTVNELKRLKELEYENARLKKMFADLSLEHEVVKDLLTKKF
jgi:putative transposase